MLELLLDPCKLCFCILTGNPALLLDFDGLLDGGDQICVDLFQGLQIHDPAFGLPGNIHTVLLQQFRVFGEQRVGGVGDASLHFQHALLPVQPQGNHDLAFPQRDGAEYRGLDLIHQHFVVVLDEADLRRRLDGNGLAQLQVMDFLFEAVHRVLKVPHRLRAHGIAFGRRLRMKPREGDFPQLLQFFLAGRNINLQFLKIFQIFFIQPIEHRDILEHLHPRLFQLLLDVVDLHLQLFIPLHKPFDRPGGVFQKGDFIQWAVLQLVNARILDL